MSGTVRLERKNGVGFLVIDNPSVNAGSSDVRIALLDCVAKVEADEHLIAGVLIGAGSIFMSGSDLREFDLPLTSPQLEKLLSIIRKVGLAD